MPVTTLVIAALLSAPPAAPPPTPWPIATGADIAAPDTLTSRAPIRYDHVAHASTWPLTVTLPRFTAACRRPGPTTDEPAAVTASSDDDEQASALRFETPPEFGSKGSWRWNVRLGAGTDVETIENAMFLAGLGADYFIAPGLSLGAELNGLYFSQKGDDAGGVNVALLLRWHFFRRPGYSVFADAGAGLLLLTSDVPADGSSFAFTPQLGAGVTIRLREPTRLMLGLKWFHVSNAQTFRDNPGRDHVYGYAGVSFGF